jgi:pimeloyl-ACP methyl ester carboxylesterase
VSGFPINAADLFVERNDTNSTQRIVIPADDGKVAWSDVARGIARAQRLDDDVLRRYLPSGKLDVHRNGAPFTLVALNIALPGVRMRLLKGENKEVKSLEILIDKNAFESTRRDVTALIRRQANRKLSKEAILEYGLKLPDHWQDTDGTKSLVILVHGFNSRSQYMSGLGETVAQRGLPSATFAYPNDESIDADARRLSDSLKIHAQKYPQQSIILVTNSMGGLVARAVVEDPELDPGNVRRLIMIAPPNHGSALAQTAHGLDVWEHFLLPNQRDELSRCVASICDGLAEANRDLRPNSPFLQQLNARSRNENVRYSILLGTKAPMTEESLEAVSTAMKDTSRRSKTIRFFQPLVSDFLADLDEVVCDKGDGVVAVKRGRLDGVEDIVLLPFRHPAAMGIHPIAIEPQLRDAILARLPEE